MNRQDRYLIDRENDVFPLNTIIEIKSLAQVNVYGETIYDCYVILPDGIRFEYTVEEDFIMWNCSGNKHLNESLIGEKSNAEKFKNKLESVISDWNYLEELEWDEDVPNKQTLDSITYLKSSILPYLELRDIEVEQLSDTVSMKKPVRKPRKPKDELKSWMKKEGLI